MNQQLVAATCGGERPNRLDRLGAAVPPHLAVTHHHSTPLLLVALPVAELTHIEDSGGSNESMDDEGMSATLLLLTLALAGAREPRMRKRIEGYRSAGTTRWPGAGASGCPTTPSRGSWS